MLNSEGNSNEVSGRQLTVHVADAGGGLLTALTTAEGWMIRLAEYGGTYTDVYLSSHSKPERLVDTISNGISTTDDLINAARKWAAENAGGFPDYYASGVNVSSSDVPEAKAVAFIDRPINDDPGRYFGSHEPAHYVGSLPEAWQELRYWAVVGWAMNEPTESHQVMITAGQMQDAIRRHVLGVEA